MVSDEPYPGGRVLIGRMAIWLLIVQGKSMLAAELAVDGQAGAGQEVSRRSTLCPRAS
jgi:hypothetical protein